MHGVKRERILRIILNHPEGKLSKYRVAKLSMCSTSWTIEYLQNLEKDGYVKGTKVIKPEALLDYWASITRKPMRYDFFVESPTEFLSDLREEYALTTYLAENLLNHYLFPARIDLYIQQEDLPLWKENITRKGLVGKGNLRLLIYDPHVFYNRQKLGDLWVASIPQVLIDLKREGGVCLEAYEILVKRYVRKHGN